MPASRDRSVVRSSVIPSAKYCCSGSVLRLANGSTTIDRRGAMAGGESDAAAGVLATVGLGEDRVADHSDQVMAAMTSATAATAAVTRRTPRRRRDASAGTLAAGRLATASWRGAETCAGRAMFLSLVEPLGGLSRTWP